MLSWIQQLFENPAYADLAKAKKHQSDRAQKAERERDEARRMILVLTKERDDNKTDFYQVRADFLKEIAQKNELQKCLTTATEDLESVTAGALKLEEELRKVTIDRDSAKDRIAWLEGELDPPVCRLQFPDGTVPGNAREAAEGWKHWYDEAKDLYSVRFANGVAAANELAQKREDKAVQFERDKLAILQSKHSALIHGLNDLCMVANEHDERTDCGANGRPLVGEEHEA